MKKVILTLFWVTLTTITFGQSSLPKGNSQINGGVGLSTWGIPVYLGFDYAVHQDITIGAEASFRGYRENWKSNKYNHSIVGIAGNANYHFNTLLKIPSNWDFYAGVNLGFFIWNSPNNYPGVGSNGIGLGGQLGGRYFFSNKVGINLEVGGGNAFSGGKFGLTIKL
jgi:hypothetical protein